MAVVQHEITVSEEPRNMPGFKHVASCVCGFMARVKDKAEAEGKAAAHALYHGVTYVPKVVEEAVKETAPATTSGTGNAVKPQISPISIGNKPN